MVRCKQPVRGWPLSKVTGIWLNSKVTSPGTGSVPHVQIHMCSEVKAGGSGVPGQLGQGSEALSKTSNIKPTNKPVAIFVSSVVKDREGAGSPTPSHLPLDNNSF